MPTSTIVAVVVTAVGTALAVGSSAVQNFFHCFKPILNQQRSVFSKTRDPVTEEERDAASTLAPTSTVCPAAEQAPVAAPPQAATAEPPQAQPSEVKSEASNGLAYSTELQMLLDQERAVMQAEFQARQAHVQKKMTAEYAVLLDRLAEAERGQKEEAWLRKEAENKAYEARISQSSFDSVPPLPHEVGTCVTPQMVQANDDRNKVIEDSIQQIRESSDCMFPETSGSFREQSGGSSCSRREIMESAAVARRPRPVNSSAPRSSPRLGPGSYGLLSGQIDRRGASPPKANDVAQEQMAPPPPVSELYTPISIRAGSRKSPLLSGGSIGSQRSNCPASPGTDSDTSEVTPSRRVQLSGGSQRRTLTASPGLYSDTGEGPRTVMIPASEQPRLGLGSLANGTLTHTRVIPPPGGFAQPEPEPTVIESAPSGIAMSESINSSLPQLPRVQAWPVKADDEDVSREDSLLREARERSFISTWVSPQWVSPQVIEDPPAAIPQSNSVSLGGGWAVNRLAVAPPSPPPQARSSSKYSSSSSSSLKGPQPNSSSGGLKASGVQSSHLAVSPGSAWRTTGQCATSGSSGSLRPISGGRGPSHSPKSRPAWAPRVSSNGKIAAAVVVRQDASWIQQDKHSGSMTYPVVAGASCAGSVTYPVVAFREGSWPQQSVAFREGSWPQQSVAFREGSWPQQSNQKAVSLGSPIQTYREHTAPPSTASVLTASTVMWSSAAPGRTYITSPR